MANPPHTITHIDIAARRDRVRELSNMTATGISDDDMDMKLVMAESVIDAAFGGWPADDDPDAQIRYIQAGNLLAAQNILLGIGGTENINTSDKLFRQMEMVIKVQNEKSPDQNIDTAEVTDGFNPDTEGDFA